MNPLEVSELIFFYKSTIFCLNSIWIQNKSTVSMDLFSSLRISCKSFFLKSNYSSIPLFFANSLWIHHLLREFTRNFSWQMVLTNPNLKKSDRGVRLLPLSFLSDCPEKIQKFLIQNIGQSGDREKRNSGGGVEAHILIFEIWICKNNLPWIGEDEFPLLFANSL